MRTKLFSVICHFLGKSNELVDRLLFMMYEGTTHYNYNNNHGGRELEDTFFISEESNINGKFKPAEISSLMNFYQEFKNEYPRELADCNNYLKKYSISPDETYERNPQRVEYGCCIFRLFDNNNFVRDLRRIFENDKFDMWYLYHFSFCEYNNVSLMLKLLKSNYSDVFPDIIKRLEKYNKKYGQKDELLCDKQFLTQKRWDFVQLYGFMEETPCYKDLIGRNTYFTQKFISQDNVSWLIKHLQETYYDYKLHQKLKEYCLKYDIICPDIVQPKKSKQNDMIGVTASEKAKLIAEIEALRNDKICLETNIESRQVKLANLNEMCTNVQSTYDNIHRDTNELKKFMLSNLEKQYELHKINTEITTQTEYLDKLIENIRTSASEYSKKQRQIIEIEQKIKYVNIKHAHKISKLDNLACNLNSLNEMYEEKGLLFDEKEIEFQEMQKKIEQGLKSDEYLEVTQKVKEKQALLESLQSQVDDMTKKMKVANDINTMTQKLTKLKTEYDQKRLDILNDYKPEPISEPNGLFSSIGVAFKKINNYYSDRQCQQTDTVSVSPEQKQKYQELTINLKKNTPFQVIKQFLHYINDPKWNNCDYEYFIEQVQSYKINGKNCMQIGNVRPFIKLLKKMQTTGRMLKVLNEYQCWVDRDE